MAKGFTIFNNYLTLVKVEKKLPKSLAVSFLFITLATLNKKERIMSNEEVTREERFGKWNVFYDGGKIETLATHKKMTPAEALKHFKKAICVKGVNF